MSNTDMEVTIMDGMRCPNCGRCNTLALNLGDGYGDCFCPDCKMWCGFEEPPHTPNPGDDRAAHLVRGTVEPVVGSLNREEV